MSILLSCFLLFILNMYFIYSRKTIYIFIAYIHTHRFYRCCTGHRLFLRLGRYIVVERMIVVFIHMGQTRCEPALESLPGLFDGGSQPPKMEAQALLMISTFRGVILKKTSFTDQFSFCLR